MQIESLKDLEKLVKLMRKTGIDKIEVSGIKLELGSLPSKPNGKKSITSMKQFHETYLPGGVDEHTPIPLPDHVDMPDELTEEQKLFWSAEGGTSLGPGETL